MSKKIFLSFLFVLGILSGRFDVKADNSNYLNNRYPLIRKPYMELPLGSIKAKGWLLEMLVRIRNGAGSLVERYSIRFAHRLWDEFCVRLYQ